MTVVELVYNNVASPMQDPLRGILFQIMYNR